MNVRSLFIALCSVPFMATAATNGQDEGAELRALDWHAGPRAEQILGKATLNTANPETMYLDEANSSKFLKLTGNLPAPGYNIILSTTGDWWAGFSFDPIGYVKDNEKIDSDDLLKKLKDSDGPSNEERKRQGLPELHTEGWYIPPHYDEQTKRLEWGVKLRSQEGINLNYTIRLLGRTGVMSATLVSSPETLDKDIVGFKQVLNGFDFNAGERYAEYKEGDRIAEYGLAALIAGGTAAVATKKGLWAVIGGFLASAWKLVSAAVIAGFAGLRAIFKKKDR